MADLFANLDLSGTGFCASFNFRRAARAVTRLYDQALQKFGIRSTQFSILVAVAKFQPVSIGRLAAVLVTDHTTLTRSLGLMKKQGLLSVSPRSIKRQRFLTLTAQGEKVLSEALPEWRKVQERFVQLVGPDYWFKLRNELENVSSLASNLDPALLDVKKASS
jgi:DNA-binding MarR family transcriptional regulator